MKTTIKRLLVPCLYLLAASTAVADETDRLSLHGFASQGYLYSNNNDFFGDSTDGSWEYYEAGLNASLILTDRLHLAGQLMSRDAGNTDNGSVRTDYMFLDFRALDLPETGLGMRFGRVRNPFGFYNDSRDVLFTRPTVLLPQSVYFDGNGVRELLFSSDGVQAYSHWNWQGHTTSLTATFGHDKKLSEDVANNLFGSALNGQMEMLSPQFVQLTHDVNGGEWRFALSSFTTSLNLSAPIFSGVLTADINVFSVQRNWERLTLTSEYSLQSYRFSFAGQNRGSRSEGAYLQAEYRLSPALTAISRYDLHVGDQDDFNGTDSHDLMLGLRWQPHPRWVVAADLHGIRGTAGIPLADNPQGIEERSELLVVMAGFRF